MALWSSIPILGDLLGKIADKIAPDKGKIIDGQNRINEAELSGAPASRLRLWRSFLGWVLALVFAWEIVGRPIMATYYPEIILPPSMIKEVSHLLLGMLGLGF
ncbi:3TM-type holin [Desulfovibrio litoralis]|uniref:Holin of 3TMs, for gene-transfer release n=1 Tax=Desulfovibrio litoralis DSM 11393 TaxID=1121455 RepID=A0A1M7TIS9_9BACT|nr:3TM-type holin [Desulfovibrio litoralis]SHN70617.1 Holin of 3TMs, for gene-transfer release [Desulfovibrio litoralis DSM 11393]